MAKIEVDSEYCKGCLLCINVCPKKIIDRSVNYNSKGYRYVVQTQEEKCTGCKLCAIMCPDAVISVYK